MPKRDDLKSILVIGAGPIIIGQACEFDYSGVQACKALKDTGFKVILVNSNPATIMTDPDIADAIYIEPINWATVAKIIEEEKPDAILPTMGGQTGLNCALDLRRNGVLEKHNVEMIGASPESIDMAEDRELFKKAMSEIGLQSAQSSLAHSLDEAIEQQKKIGYPTIIRPSFTLGGSGGGIATNESEFLEIVAHGLEVSPTSEVLLEESLLGWKEYEMEVVRDCKDNCIIVCSIENLDPMGIHTGDSITVAPAQTLTDKEYQIMRNASIDVLRKIGVDTGGSNVQFAVNPDNGQLIIIEMNPRVSRSSALASKATGFPIAKIAAKLAVGFTLDELQNDITGGLTPASFEPTIDYVVTKVPRFTFEKFPKANDRLTTQMKSVGEAMAIGRTFQESMQKALRSLEISSYGFETFLDQKNKNNQDILNKELKDAGPRRLWYIADAFRFGMNINEVNQLTGVDKWFLSEIEDIVNTEKDIQAQELSSISKELLFSYKQKGFSDKRLSMLMDTSEQAVRHHRHSLNIHPVYKHVDTCAAEFSTSTAYLYSTYEEHCEANPTKNKKIIVLGGGPNRIGQGIEFDYCCVHAALASKEEGFESIMINCNPETVSTDYDTSDRLYFEPLTLEDVLEIVRLEKPYGVIVQYGGQTPLKLANELEEEGAPIIGTSPDSIDLAEDRERFQALLQELELLQPPNATVREPKEAGHLADNIGYPLVVRPSYVLGGRAMEVVFNQDELLQYLQEAVNVSDDSPVLLDKFLDDAIEVDVDVICDGHNVLVGGIMQHIEQAGVHSGDSACSLPSYSINKEIEEQIRENVGKLARRLNVIGLMNAQLAVKNNKIYVLEVNPRASRTVPFVSKSTGKPLAKIAAKCMLGRSLTEQEQTQEAKLSYFSVKEAVFPFVKFPGVDPILGPEMKSTGEVMGVGFSFGEAFAKSQLAAGITIPSEGTVLISVRDEDKEPMLSVASELISLGFSIIATSGTHAILQENNIKSQRVNKVAQGSPHVVDMISNNEVNLIVNTTQDKKAIIDSALIRREALQQKVCYTTTLTGAKALIEALRCGPLDTVRRLSLIQSEYVN
ncbi:MAG: carbamoyl-phosphate synthase large subunit [Pseudomonadota bacterium]